MGVVFGTGYCWSCGGFFSFNPHRVPSIRIDGERQPVCLNCMTIANGERVAQGMDPHPIQKDAYDPIDEREL